MSAREATTSGARAPGRPRLLASAALLCAAALAAYSNCFRAPFVYDDIEAIQENPSIRHLLPPWDALFAAPAGSTVGGRPFANLTLAVNYALGGTDVWGYHALNLLIHALAGLALFGVVRRTLDGPVLRARFGRDSLPLALATALIWTLHPLQTESVTYVVQRVESLMGLLYLLTLYAFIRSADSGRPGRWRCACVGACLLGMATKEVMATAPLMVLLYDRTFMAGSIRESWRLRRGFYLALAATWLLLPLLVATTGWNRGGSVGFNAGVAPWDYWLMQFEAVARYAGLSAWPSPLVFEYGPVRFHGIGAVAPYAAAVILLAAATLVALRRRPVLGFLGAWFFVVLAPSSIVPVATQTMAEHRMYLPLAAVAAGFVALAYALTGRRFAPLLAAAALALAVPTLWRNEAYQSDVTLWTDTVSKRPDNANARNNLGLAYFHVSRVPEAIEEYRAALALQPSYPGALNNLGNALGQSGRTAEAIEQYDSALRLEPKYAAAHFNLANTLVGAGRTAEALPHFEETLRIQPDFAVGHLDYADALSRAGRSAEAIEQYQAALRTSPGMPLAHYGLGIALTQAGKLPEAIGEYETALSLDPDMAEACKNLGVLLCATGRVSDGIEQLAAAIRLKPDYAQAHFAMGNALVQSGRTQEAVASYEEALRIAPSLAEASNNLGIILCQGGHVAEGIARIEAAIRAQPDFAPAHFARGTALLQTGHRDEAVAEFETVLRLRPDDPSALRILEMIRAAH
jgi:tetratricopeptide (TPR) repeat protein